MRLHINLSLVYIADAAVLSVIRAKNISYSVVMSTLADGYLEPQNIIVKVERIHSKAQHDYILISDNYSKYTAST